MKFNIKLHNACSTNELRPAMCCILFYGEQLIASDSYILAVVHIDDLEVKDKEREMFLKVKGKMLHRKGFLKVWNKEVYITENGLDCPSEKIFIPFEPEIGLKYPQWERVIPDSINFIQKDCIALSSELLFKLNQCFRSSSNIRNQCLLYPSKDNKGIVAFPNDNYSKSYGLIMPVMNDTERISILNKETMIFEFKNTEQK